MAAPGRRGTELRMRFFHALGRALQLAGLAVMPAAIWAGEILRSERGSITIFLASIAIFFAGWLIVRLSGQNQV
jgi:hypothetical protein